MPLQHSKVVGGSNANIVLACAGARQLWEKAPPDKGSSYAAEGTALHNAMEAMVKSEKPNELYPHSMLNWTDEETGITLSEELVYDKLAPAWDALTAYVKEHNPSVILAENQVQFAQIDGAFGTIDLFLVHDDTVVCWDWKFGYMPVHAEASPQLYFYTAAAMTTEVFKDFFKPGMTVRFAICQPKEVGETLSTWDTDIADLAGYISRLKKAVKASFEDDPELVTGSHCKWCKAKPICPKLKGEAQGVLSLDPNEVDGATLSANLELADKVEEWVRTIRAYAHESAERGNAIPHWKLVMKRATRQFTDAEKFLARLARSKQLDVKKTDLYGVPQPKSVSQVEKLIGKEMFQKLCKEDDVIARSSGTTLVHESDKRKAVVPSAALENLGSQLKASQLSK